LATPIQPKPSKKLGVSMDFNPITTYNMQGETINLLTHNNIKIISNKEKIITYEQRENESFDDYCQRVISETF
jgi:hypothetical protein